jgi:tetrahydromethanopterin S-methyltransferase subunit C
LYGTVVKSLSEAHPDFGVASAPVEVQRYDVGSVHVLGEVVGVVVGGVVGVVVGGVVGAVVGVVVGVVVGGVVGVALPVHVTPFTAKLVGAGLLPVHDPLNPNDAVPLVATEPL